MSQINCNASHCCFNQELKCAKKNVKVEGLFSRSKLGTFCQSFKNPLNAKIIQEEFANEIIDTDKQEAPKVSCTANYCAYNENSLCKARAITIGNVKAKYRSETECDSFTLK